MKTFISEYYRDQNAQLHATNRYGKWGHRQKDAVESVYRRYNCKSALDYGAGQQTLSEAVSFSLTGYDPAIPAISELPTVHDLVVCSDVLEHVEPEYLDNVLEHIQAIVEVAAYFVIATRPDGTKKLPDGRDPHICLHDKDWWEAKIGEYFNVVKCEMGERGEVIMECMPL